MLCSINIIFGCLNIFPQFLNYGIYGPLLLRIGLAAIFIVHGYPKLFGGTTQAVGFFESVGIRPGKFWVIVVGSIELFGGILLLVGFLVQLVSVLIAITMFVAIWKVKFKMGFSPPAGGGWEFDFVLLLMAIALLVLGGGAYSIDLPL